MTALDPIEQARALRASEHGTRAEIEALQQRRLDALVRHAREHAPHYREWLPATDGPVELRSLPTLDKATLMERFDEVVCDPRLRRDAIEAHLAGPPRADPYLGDYRVMGTSGSSGRPGLFVYDPRAGLPMSLSSCA